MSSPFEIDINEYDYELPDGRIAKFPLPERDASRLLLYRGGAISHTVFRELPELLPPGALLLFNNTRVIHARLLFRRPTGARIEVLCLEPIAPADHQLSLSSEEAVVWKCFIGNNKRWKEDELAMDIDTPHGTARLFAQRLEMVEDAYTVRFRHEGPRLAFGELLHYAGLIPLPPYLHRDSVPEDEDRYQTVYARQEGSVAAPTAGLHFTEAVMEKLKDKGIQQAFVTLHVGAGTFLPVKAQRLADHHMHEEQMMVSHETIELLLRAVQEGRPVIPVGTTSLRTLESLYWYGAAPGDPAANSELGQWTPYTAPHTLSPAGALERLLELPGPFTGHTRLLIAPGYPLRLASGLITNFHQPRSTLLLLIAALVGEDWKRIYDYALREDFRFLSYGDSSLLLP